MLDHVAANQTRYVAPGLAPDSRGVALGRYCMVLLPSADRVVGLLRGLSESTSLDDLLPKMKIIQVKTPLQSQEFLVRLPTQGSFAADTVAQVANLMQGLTFTGSSKHFVQYRDSRSPLGYDVDALHSGAGDYVLYAADFVQAYQRVRELPFDRLALSLSLERVRADRVLPDEELLVRAVPGLWRFVVSYLHRNNLPCEAAACETTPRQGAQQAERFYLVRTRLQPRMEALFRRTPGLELYRFKGDRVAVQLGFCHPLELTSCSSIFPAGRFHLFSGARDRLDTVVGLPTYVSASALVSLGAAARAPDAGSAAPAQVEGVEVTLRLVVSLGQRPPVSATRIPLARATWLKKLVYMLPPQVLEQTLICVAGDQIYLHNGRGLEYIPLGEMYYEVADGVQVPVGYELIPRVHPEVLLQHLKGGQDKLFFFTRDSPEPLLISRSSFAPLSRRALAHVPVRPAETQQLARPVDPPRVTLVNDRLSSFPLWGFADRGPAGDEE